MWPHDARLREKDCRHLFMCGVKGTFARSIPISYRLPVYWPVTCGMYRHAQSNCIPFNLCQFTSPICATGLAIYPRAALDLTNLTAESEESRQGRCNGVTAERILRNNGHSLKGLAEGGCPFHNGHPFPYSSAQMGTSILCLC